MLHRFRSIFRKKFTKGEDHAAALVYKKLQDRPTPTQLQAWLRRNFPNIKGKIDE